MSQALPLVTRQNDRIAIVAVTYAVCPAGDGFPRRSSR